MQFVFRRDLLESEIVVLGQKRRIDTFCYRISSLGRVVLGFVVVGVEVRELILNP